jgi:hypothetical protein
VDGGQHIQGFDGWNAAGEQVHARDAGAPPERNQTKPRSETPNAPEPGRSALTAASGKREIAVQLNAPDTKPVEVRVQEHAGQVKVSVRCQDDILTASLQNHLPQLTSDLRHNGFDVEAWIPTGGYGSRQEEPALAAQKGGQAENELPQGQSGGNQPRDEGRRRNRPGQFLKELSERAFEEDSPNNLGGVLAQ